MTLFITIIIVSALVAFLFSVRKKKEVATTDSPLQNEKQLEEDRKDSAEVLMDDHGRRYKQIVRTREVPRKTFLLGRLHGKYWGEIDIIKEEEYEYSKFFDFHIYEIQVQTEKLNDCACRKQPCFGLHTETEGPFDFISNANFPRERLPQLLPVQLKQGKRIFAVNIYEPQIANVKFISKLHQTDGREIFGTIVAEITGYLLDFKTEEYQEKQFFQDSTTIPITEPPLPDKTLVPTGNVEYSNNYYRTEYYYSDHKSRYWNDWKYKRTTKSATNEGCLSFGIGIIGGAIGIAFVLMLLPRLAVLLPFFLLPILFRFISWSAWNWIFRIVGLALVVGLLLSIFSDLRHSSGSYLPRVVSQDNTNERNPEYTPVVDTINQTPSRDTLINHYRSWKDYSDIQYEGKFWVRKSALRNASIFKNTLSIPASTDQGYNEVVFRLKENDKNNLQGVYQLFDSIKTANKLTVNQFPEMIVSFIQDIPYSVVLSDACDPSLYPDRFIKNYLSSKDARCDGYERFGINTPVEFMANLNGDCDTRTLLIYTLLSHYGYDVMMLSSEYYNHSLIGINLPYDGIYFPFNNQRYVLWETTAAGIRPGMLPQEISNLNYWKISLKSK